MEPDHQPPAPAERLDQGQQLPVEIEVQKANRAYRDLNNLIISQIHQEYSKISKGKAST